MPRATFIAQHQVRGLKRPQTVDGALVEHVVQPGGEIDLDTEHPETVRLVGLNVLAEKPKAAEPAKK